MHMADALLSPQVAATMGVLSTATLGTSLYKIKKNDEINQIPTMAVSAALVFAGQMINYTIPGTGSSGHMCGGMLLTALLGPHAAFLSMVVILAVQCLLFADGGLMALGANCFNMAFYGCFAGYYLIWKPILHSKLFHTADTNKANRSKIALASILGCILTLQLGAFSVVLETKMSGITELPFLPFLSIMQPIHLAIGAIEGVVTSSVLMYVYQSRPELIKGISTDESVKNKYSYKSTILVLAICTVFIAGGLSLFASSNPDGLEWSMFGNKENGYSENMALDEKNYGIQNELNDNAAIIQEKIALLPDYSFKNSDSGAGTSFSGILGSVIVAAIALITVLFTKKFKPKH